MEQMDLWSKSETTNQTLTLCWLLLQLHVPLKIKYIELVR